MKFDRKYTTDKITQSTKNRLIIRKGGYYPARIMTLFLTLVFLIALTAYFLSIGSSLWTVLLYPLGFVVLFGKQFIKYTSLFGKKVSVNNKRIILQSYKGFGNRKTFKKVNIKSLICSKQGENYEFTIYNIKNEKIQFSITNNRNRNPMNDISKFLNLKKVHQSKVLNKITTRYWTRNPNTLRSQREIQNIGEELHEYRSNYFTIISNEDQLTFNTNGIQNKVVIKKKNRSLQYVDKKEHLRSISTNTIISIDYRIEENTSVQKDNEITILITALTTNKEEILLLRNIITEKDQANLQILDIELDYKNLVAIMDMTIKSAIDEGLDTLDLDTLDLKPLPEKLKSDDQLNS